MGLTRPGAAMCSDRRDKICSRPTSVTARVEKDDHRVHTKGVMQPHATLRRVLRRFFNSKCFLEGFLESACKGCSVKTRFFEGFLEGSVS